MASKIVEDAITTFLQANWTACPVLAENQKGSTPTDGAPFLQLSFPVSSSRRLTLGSPATYREDGGFRIIINARRGKGAAQMRDWGDQLASLFRYRKVETVHCLAPSEPFTDDRSEAGNYYQGAATVPFWRSFKET